MCIYLIWIFNTYILLVWQSREITRFRSLIWNVYQPPLSARMWEIGLCNSWSFLTQAQIWAIWDLRPRWLLWKHCISGLCGFFPTVPFLFSVHPWPGARARSLPFASELCGVSPWRVWPAEEEGLTIALQPWLTFTKGQMSVAWFPKRAQSNPEDLGDSGNSTGNDAVGELDGTKRRDGW